MSEDQSISQSSEPILTTNEPEVIPPFLAYVGINQAARLIGKGKTQIYNDIKAGKLSWHIEDDKKLLRIADLDRVYGLKVNTSTESGIQNQNIPPMPVNQNANTPLDTSIELAVLKADLRSKEDALRRADEEIRDLRQKQDKQLETIQRLTLLLPAPQSAASEPTSSPPPVEHKSFWKRLFS